MTGDPAAIPPRTATDAYLARMGGSRRIDLAFDVDLGELVEGHRVVARGLELSDGGGVLHYELVPGLRPGETAAKGSFFWYWMLSVEDDLGTPYLDDNTGAFDPEEGKAAAHGVRDLGGAVPGEARLLRIGLRPAEGWTPPRPWCRLLEVALPDGPVTPHPSG
ncbi:hypothetical protein MF672_025225 [Actinomadura sp. ATCC 31491]|uniref:Uncharacterized protein n=1 Tax=Actinomadura luzonensis TaxID=2805427 RepID=A0ABT0FXJ4_9ACTN|nr:hypothetical protein [Actinomadura luzonensis]MCK2217069.1 hypothetical protein [Actinomadura luzonensis]